MIGFSTTGSLNSLKRSNFSSPKLNNWLSSTRSLCLNLAFVTASHNPAEYNGFKFAHDYSETLVEEGMKELKRLVEEEDYELATNPASIKKTNIRDFYLDDLKKRFSFKKEFKVVVDAGFATAGAFVPDFLESFGVKVVRANCTLDATFPLGAPDPTETAVAQRLAQQELTEKEYISLTEDEKLICYPVIETNYVDSIPIKTTNPKIIELFEHYKIKR